MSCFIIYLVDHLNISLASMSVSATDASFPIWNERKSDLGARLLTGRSAFVFRHMWYVQASFELNLTSCLVSTEALFSEAEWLDCENNHCTVEALNHVSCALMPFLFNISILKCMRYVAETTCYIS